MRDASSDVEDLFRAEESASAIRLRSGARRERIKDSRTMFAVADTRGSVRLTEGRARLAGGRALLGTEQRRRQDGDG